MKYLYKITLGEKCNRIRENRGWHKYHLGNLDILKYYDKKMTLQLGFLKLPTSNEQ